MDWELIRQWKQAQIIKENIHENNKRYDHDYIVGDKFILTNNYAYKYEIPYNRPFVIKEFWTNDAVTLQCGTIKVRHNICHIKPYTSDTNIEDIKQKLMIDDLKLGMYLLYTSVLY